MNCKQDVLVNGLRLVAQQLVDEGREASCDLVNEAADTIKTAALGYTREQMVLIGYFNVKYNSFFTNHDVAATAIVQERMQSGEVIPLYAHQTTHKVTP